MRKKHDFYPQIADATIAAIAKESQVYLQWKATYEQAAADFSKNELSKYPVNITNAFRQFTDNVLLKEPKPGFRRTSTESNFHEVDLVRYFNKEAYQEADHMWNGIEDIKSHFIKWHTLDQKLVDTLDLTYLKSATNVVDGHKKLIFMDGNSAEANISMTLTMNSDGLLDGPIMIVSNKSKCKFYSSLPIALPQITPRTTHSKQPDLITPEKLKTVLINPSLYESHSAESKLFVITLIEQVLKGVKVDLDQFSDLISPLPTSCIWDSADIYCKELTQGPNDVDLWKDSLRHLHRLTKKGCASVIDQIIASTIAACADTEQKVQIVIALNKIKDDGSRFGDYLTNEAPKYLMLSNCWGSEVAAFKEKQACLDLSYKIDSLLLDGNVYTEEYLPVEDDEYQVEMNNCL